MQGVALVPGSGEYSLGTEPVYLEKFRGETVAANVHNDLGAPDLVASIDHLAAELPNAKSVSLIVSWFGDDLRCDRCTLRPAVEQAATDGDPMPWRVAGRDRGSAHTVSRVEGRPLFGGTPADASVVQAIRHLRKSGLSTMFYPFILMDVPPGNGLQDPWAGAGEQPPVPWRGRITLSRAPGRAGSPDQTAAAAAEVAAFFGSARASDFSIDDDEVRYSGPAEWSYRRFVLHYAYLCRLAGGVESFCVGSEMRSLTQIRDGRTSYPGVRELVALSREVRTALGPDTKIGYAADWSEYFGHNPGDGSDDMVFHLDPLWADEAIDFVGIDNYMPLSDWRDGEHHADASAGSIYALDYLRSNVAGGEGYDWYYAGAAARTEQTRTPIRDDAYGEPWTFRYKDLVGWWSSEHVNRIGGAKTGEPTPWRPRSKPIWFTELGCPAVDKGTNQPNVFYDPKSSESFFPYFSNGVRDDFIQFRYLQATFGHWNDPANNPVSDVYGGRMVDMSRAHVWAWDARPWPDFPNRIETWVDGDNHPRGHWLNGRSSTASLAEVVGEICARADLAAFDVSALSGGVAGYLIDGMESARSSLQPLMVTYGVDSFSLGDEIAFANRNGRIVATVAPDACVIDGREPVVALLRGPEAESTGRVAFGYVRADLDYQAGAVEAASADIGRLGVSQMSYSVLLSDGQAKSIAERLLAEGEIARDVVDLALPPSKLWLTAGDVVEVSIEDRQDLYRVDRIDEAGARKLSAVRIEPSVYEAPVFEERRPIAPSIAASTPAYPVFLDLPLLTGEEVPHAPHLAIAKTPWAGPMAVFTANEDAGYRLNREVTRPAVIGETLGPIDRGAPGLWMEASFEVLLASGTLESQSATAVLNGANVAAIRFSKSDDWEIVQFREAELVGARTYRIGGLLRGQAGTDGVMRNVLPAGSEFVLLNGAAVQLQAQVGARGLQRHYRIGPAERSYDDPSYTHRVEAFQGAGLRPYRPVHAIIRKLANGDLSLSWVRRTQIDGDSWEGHEPPVGEEREAYHVVVRISGEIAREEEVGAPSFTYSIAQQANDNATAPISFEIAQISSQFGPGPYERIVFDA